MKTRKVRSPALVIYFNNRKLLVPRNFTCFYKEINNVFNFSLYKITLFLLSLQNISIIKICIKIINNRYM